MHTWNILQATTAHSLSRERAVSVRNQASCFSVPWGHWRELSLSKIGLEHPAGHYCTFPQQRTTCFRAEPRILFFCASRTLKRTVLPKDRRWPMVTIPPYLTSNAGEQSADIIEGRFAKRRSYLKENKNYTKLYHGITYCTAPGLYCTVLYCITLHCIAPHRTTLHCTMLYSAILQYIIMHCIARSCTARCSDMFYYIILCYTILYYSILPFTSLHCDVLHYISLHCAMLYYATRWYTMP